MPTINVLKKDLDQQLEEILTEDQFNELCFQFGIELDDVTSEYDRVVKEKGVAAADAQRNEDGQPLSKEETYAIDIPANRYDLLCPEGLGKALRVFRMQQELPRYTVKPAKHTITVKREVEGVRPFIACAILRNLKLNEKSFKSLIEFQDKLHFNLCRRRKFGSMGTHDLDTMKAPFTYTAEPPSAIKFKALKEKEVMTAEQLFEEYRKRDQCSVAEYLPLIDGSDPDLNKGDLYPVVRDSEGVMSVPPIINGARTQCHAEMTNMFLECTGIDKTKANIALNTVVCAFSQYCAEPFTVEAVEVVYEGRKEDNCTTPDLKDVVFKTTPEYINGGIGTDMKPDDIVQVFKNMMLRSRYDEGTNELIVEVPATRSDVLHPCDLVEDAAIAYGFNNVTKRLPETDTAGREYPINALSDQLRLTLSQAGYTEVLNWALQSEAENSFFDEGTQAKNDKRAVKLGNPKTKEFQCVRTTLLPGVLKALCHSNGQNALPIAMFEVSDVCLLDDTTPEGSRNERRVAAVVCDNKGGGFENIHGLMDRLMEVNGVKFVTQKELGVVAEKDDVKMDEQTEPRLLGRDQLEYSIRLTKSSPHLLPGRQAEIVYGPAQNRIGFFGLMSPATLERFGFGKEQSQNVLVAALELNAEVFLHRLPKEDGRYTSNGKQWKDFPLD